MPERWILNSFVVAVLFVPWVLGVQFFQRNYGVRPEAMLFWYFVGVIVAMPVCVRPFRIIEWGDIAPTAPILVIAVMGALLGLSSNVLLFQAIRDAPNPSFPMAIVNVSSLVTFFIAIACARAMPEQFSAAPFAFRDLFGIALVIAGVALLAFRSSPPP